MIATTISHYNILEEVGEGGMGIVYKARDLHLDRLVAIKFLPASLTSDEQITEQFIHEARAASVLDHPNICTIHEFDKTDDKRLFMVMSFCQGQTLKQIIEDTVGAHGHTPLPVDECINIATQIANGLASAHKEGIIHRDIKPANIMISDECEVKILDFGLAGVKEDIRKSAQGSTAGTAAYMSPEQAMGNPVDPRSDIWSLGVVLYQMLSGTLPFKGDYDQTLMYSILKEEPEPLSALRKEIPKKCEQVLEKALAKDPDQRYPRMEEMLKDLQALPEEPIQPKESKLTPARRRSYIYAFISGILLISLIALYLFFPDRSEVEYRKIIAVLPFENLSGDPENEYFSEGVTEDIRAQLSKIKQFRVLSRTSVLPYKDAAMNLRQIAENLNAGTVLEGTIRHDEQQIRIVTQLFDAKTEERLWTETYDREMTDIFKLQRDISIEIARALKTQITSLEHKRLDRKPTENMKAYYFYQRASNYLAQDILKEENAASAILLFKKALELDPNYAEAYAGLGRVYMRRVGYLGYPLAWLDSAKTMSKKAVKLDSNSSQAYYSLGKYYEPHYYSTSDSISNALAAYSKAIDLNPSSQKALLALGRLKRLLGYYDDALMYLNIACELNPLIPVTYYLIADVYYDQGDYDNAAQYFNQGRELEPEKEYSGFPYLDLQQGQCETAIRKLLESVKLNPDGQWLHHDLACVYKYCNKFDEAVAEFKKCLELAPNERWHYLGLAAVYAEQEQYEEAIPIYEKAMNKFPNSLFTRFEYSFVLIRSGKIKKAKKIIKDILHNPSNEFFGTDKSILQITQFYIGEIGESDMMMAINQAHERLNRIDSLTDLYYFVGMSYLLNFNHTYRNRDKAIEYLHKYHLQGNKSGVEYSLARSELQRLGVLE